MKKVLLFVMLQFLYSISWGLNVTIIESTSGGAGHLMDLKWSSVCTSMGHFPTILPQTTLDNNSFFASTGLLIISSGVVNLPANRINTIIQFLQTGKPVYLQSEYLSTYTTNQAFSFIINSFGGTFTWGTTMNGDLNPMNVLGTYATNTNSVNSLGYYWYSVNGTGDCNTANILEYGGVYHGFQYFPSNPAYGTIISTTDEDWVNDFSSQAQALMTNLITHLLNPQFNSTAVPLNLGNDTTLCPGQTLLLNPYLAGATYHWQDNSTSSTFIVTQAGTYWVQINLNGCSATDTIVVNYSNNQTIFLGNDTSLCIGDSLILDVTTPGASYLWQDGSTNPSFTVSQAGTYTVQVSIGDCSSTGTIHINYNPLPIVHLGNDTSLCEGQSLTLSAANTGASYSWQDNSVNSNFVVTQPGAYWVEVTLNQCVASDTINIAYTALPIVNLGNDTSLCQGAHLILDATTPNASYLWQNQSVSPSLTVTNPGLYWVSVNVDHCIASDTIRILYKSGPVVNLGKDITLCEGESILLNATTTGASYTWQDHSASSIYKADHQGLYWVIVTTLCGVDRDSIYIKMVQCSCNLYIPNAFTPDGDYLNDDFYPISDCQFSEYQLLIFNRWGEKIFETSTPGEGWDGYNQGDVCPLGVYVYLFIYKFDQGAREMRTGRVILVK